jgi:[acyl-carrier-protein] S-malonyltransferase
LNDGHGEFPAAKFLGTVEAVNFNAPGQVVIAGHRAAVERAVDQAREAGARRAVMLAVSVPAHSSLMRPAAEAFAEALQAAPIASPRLPVVNNVDVAAQSDPPRIRDALLRQLYSPVRWIETVQTMRRQGVDTFAECGPGRVLAGLVRRIDKDLIVHALTDADALHAALHAVRGKHDGK